MQTEFFFALDASTEAAVDKHLIAHLRSLEICWPEWPGPTPGGDAQVHELFAESLTHGGNRYHYMAPVRLLFEIAEDVWIAVVEYAPGSTCWRLNGELLRLPLTNIWPPVKRLMTARKAA